MLLLVQWAATLLVQWVTTVVVALFMLPWTLIILRQPSTALRSIFLNWPLIILPGLALSSAVWSDYPLWSLRAGAQFVATTVIGIVAGYCVMPRALLSALLSALAFIAVLSVLDGTVRPVGLTGEFALVGLFGSKNSFALCVSLLLLTGAVVSFDRSQLYTFRAIGLASAVSAPALLIYAKSVGALVVSIASLAILVLLLFALHLKPINRMAIFVFLLCLALAVAALGLLFIDDIPQLLTYLGKNETLTGRIVLWQRALDSIAQQPILGVGYQAFWQVGNWSAEVLWLYAKIEGKYGYHFHNTYLQVAVDLGAIGLSIFLWIMIVITHRLLAILIGKPTIEQLFATVVFVFLLFRTPIEVDLFFQFQIASILICLIWIYAKSPRKTFTSKPYPVHMEQKRSY
jgi:exopolysaccharide production protein ExoQ